jgi:hypothetical protein
MGLPIFETSVRTSQVTSGQVLCSLLPQASALGTGRIIRLRGMAISNTTATGFGIGWGLATAAGATPGAAAGVILRRGSAVIDAASVVQAVYTTYGTQPTAPAAYNGRLFVPGAGTLIWTWDNGEELIVPPAATALPFAIWNTGAGQVSDVTLWWEE